MKLWVNKYELAWSKKMQEEGKTRSLKCSTFKTEDEDIEVEFKETGQ